MSDENNPKSEKKGLHITVDDRALQIMSDANSELKQENKQLSEALTQSAEAEKVFDDLKNRLKSDYAKLGEVAPDINTSEEFDLAIQQLGKLKQSKVGAPSGTPNTLNERQLGRSQDNSDLMTRKFNSPEEMISFLRAQKTKESEAILNKMWQKTLEAQKSGNIDLTYRRNPTEEKGDGNPVEKVISGEIDNSDESELESWGVRKKTHKSKMSHTDKEGNPIGQS
ncbi:MAG: hypothetical protein ABSB89_11025 [Candidatus Bathyarchaeia archaeon]